MYALRRRWVPAFFKDIPMSGLMRTTSLSEGQNWSFQNNTLTGSYILMFMMAFEGVMERQRRNQFVNDFNTATTLPRFITSSPIEPHASKVYTHNFFYQVQKEISDSDNTCFQMSVTSNNGVDIIIVLEMQKNISTRQPSSPIVDDKLEEYHYDCLIEDTQYMVTHSTIDGSHKCTCMHFEHVGLLCRHIFCVFKYYNIEQIPKEYIMRWWRWDVIPTEFLKRRFSNSLLDSNSDMTATKIFSNVDRCVSFLSHDAPKLKSYLEELNKPKKKIIDDCPAPEIPSRESFYNQIIGVELTNDVPDIENPSHNKGTGSRGKRLKSK
ncbi:protein FAR1-RELATED SEQUENCE 3-like [Lactuca sativa]|uniref:protein FAR1-RELATED SEQUENCE 3-like n=1 Tax=Lactuca sativa TaxID=4236 RepID=UPI000CD8375A|nr:protein FAR1-RELATED SEQUENCE 3-like [Lactuca sativa]